MSDQDSGEQSKKPIKIPRQRKRLYEAAEVEEQPTEESAQPETIRAITSTREEKALGEVKNHVIMAMGAGAVPLSILDLAGVVWVQLRLLSHLSKVYGVPYNESRGISIIASLTGGFGVVMIGSIGASFTKLFPVVGQFLGATSMPIFSGAATYALGKVFIMHFESGETFLSFQPAKVKKYYAEQLGVGKELASNIKEKKK